MQNYQKNVDTSIERVKPENYMNYFKYTYGTTKKQNIQENHQHENINYNYKDVSNWI